MIHRIRAILITLFLLVTTAVVHAETVTVSAAISLKEALQDIRKIYETKSPDHVVFNFDASGKLAIQIQQGAPVDVFVSADQEQMEKLVKSGEVSKGNERVVADNTLVLIAPANSVDRPRSFSDLAVDHGQKLAIGEPRTVPAGRYAMQTLKTLHLDEKIRDRLVFGESVRQVLSYVEQGQVYAGIVYGTDAKEAGDQVKLIATADPDTHERIEYPAAIVTRSRHATGAVKFLDFLGSSAARAILIDKGFSIPVDKPASTGPAR